MDSTEKFSLAYLKLKVIIANLDRTKFCKFSRRQPVSSEEMHNVLHSTTQCRSVEYLTTLSCSAGQHQISQLLFHFPIHINSFDCHIHINTTTHWVRL